MLIKCEKVVGKRAASENVFKDHLSRAPLFLWPILCQFFKEMDSKSQFQSIPYSCML